MIEAEDLSTYCKRNCNFDVSEVAMLAEVPRRTLYDWWNNRRRAVELIVKGIAVEHNECAETAQNELRYVRFPLIIDLSRRGWSSLDGVATMNENKHEHLTVTNANVQEMEKSLKESTFGEHDMVEVVASILVTHYEDDFNRANEFELNYLLVRESILAHHGQLVGDSYPGRFALRLLRNAQDGKLGLVFNAQSRLHSLLFTGLNS